ncbi:acylglycerol kinase family protein [Streptococcus equi subsp. zooepidemicus]|uniref:acylglycerol kinase family protein n=1 Tax=Streptococcus equi TaxID=1336 RepID=UPI001E6300A7|nr:acylglycerol kinase family protein [Streptococcus equi]MCD3402058.1 acylglycerol kinase family protein [Streptococcus equi subsp. zooepidemicus]
MKKALLIVNPSSGGEKAKEYEALAYDKLASYLMMLTLSTLKKEEMPNGLLMRQPSSGWTVSFVMGGDGTVNEGISGLAEQDYRPKFGFFPLGTVNDLARALGMSLDPEEAIIR